MKNTMTTAQCLEVLFKEHGNLKTRQLLAKFTGSSVQSVKRWQLQGMLPEGKHMIRLRYFLETVGLVPIELENISKDFRIVGRSIAFGVLNEEFVAKKIGCMKIQQLYRYFSGGNGIAKERIHILAQIAEDIGIQTQKRLQRYVELLPTEFKMTSLSVGNSDNSQMSAEDEQTIKEFIKSAESLRTYGAKLLSGSREVRFALRKMMTQDEPLLHLTWETVNNLLNERSK